MDLQFLSTDQMYQQSAIYNIQQQIYAHIEKVYKRKGTAHPIVEYEYDSDH